MDDIAASTANGAADTPRSAAAAAALASAGKMGRRINYGLRESVVRMDVLDQVRMPCDPVQLPRHSGKQLLVATLFRQHGIPALTQRAS